MSYPPTPPGSWGSNPGPDPGQYPQGGDPNYGGYPPASGQPQHGGYPPAEGYPPQAPPNYPASGPGYGADPYSGAPQQQYPPQAQPGSGMPYGAQQSTPYGVNDPYHQQQPYGYGQPPPEKSNTGLVLGIVASVLLVAILAVGGFLLFKGDDDDSGDKKASPSDDTSTSASANASPTGELVEPSSGSFSFRMPKGFEETTTSESGGKAIKPSATTSTRDQITVAPFSRFTATTIDELETQVRGQANSSAQLGPITKVKVDGQDALKVDVEFNGDNSRNYFIISGTSDGILYVYCLWSAEEATIKTACDQVVKSMKIGS